MPSLAARSAGEVGCSPDEISVSGEEFHPGLFQSGETWVAECRGRTFHCTQMNAEPRKHQLFQLASDQISCQEQAENPEEVANREARREPHARAIANVPVSAPTGAAGFDFGVGRAEAQRRCEAAGREWSHGDGVSTCSGPAAELGMTARVHLNFCGDRACRVMIEQQPPRDWASRAVSLKTQLESKYGPPQSSNSSVPKACRAEDAFVRCLEQDTLHLSYKWRWASGEALELEVGKPSPKQNASIRLLYSRPKRTVNLSAL
jgi:hypothetical protein